MKQMKFNPFFAVTADAGATSATSTQAVYLHNVDNSRPVKATVRATGTWGSATLNIKFEDSADNVTFADVTGGAFTAMTVDTAAGGVAITFTIGANIGQNDSTANYGKYIRCEWATSGGSGSDLDIDVVFSEIFTPDDDIEMRLEPVPIP